jgi:ABC-type multidrug transport system fused ATPase/permease subunit
VLVVDEAPSALDTATESSAMESIDRISERLTVAMVACRLNTLSHYNRVMKLKARLVEKFYPAESFSMLNL